MIRNYLKIALRNLVKNKVYSFINIAGLAVGLSVCTLILLFVSHEHSYDRFHKEADRIYWVSALFKYGDQEINTPAMSARLGPAIKESVAGVEEVVRISNVGSVIVRSDYAHIGSEANFLLVDRAFFEVFDFPFLKGNPKNAIAQPMQVAISERMSTKYFGTQNPIGQTINYNTKLFFTVTGVIANPRSNSSLQPDFVANIESLRQTEKLSPWYDPSENPSELDNQLVQLGSFKTYFKIKNQSVASAIPAQIKALIAKQNKEKTAVSTNQFFVHSLVGSHLDSGSYTDNARLVSVFGWVALLVLVLALVNYMSITTARATLRAKEVGIRKAAGASRGSLIKQFYFESSFITLLAFGCSMLLFQTFQSAFLNLLNLKMDNSFVSSAPFLGAVALVLLLCVVLSGSYPALMLSAFRPIEVLKGRLGLKSGGVGLRKGFAVFQFGVSIALVCCSIIIQQQLHFFQNKDTGLQKEQVIGIGFGGGMAKNIGPFQEGIKQLTGAVELPMSSFGVFKDGYNAFFTKSPINNKEVSLMIMNINSAFLNFFGFQWQQKPDDLSRLGAKNTILVNEVAAEQLGLNAKNKGTKFKLGSEKFESIGVLKNVHLSSLHAKVMPLALLASKNITTENAGNGGYFYVRLSATQNIKATIDRIAALHKNLNPEAPFNYYFLDEAFAANYQTEQRLSKMFYIFTALAIFIACLGLFGLATFTVEQRTKEIGIRKVLGASVAGITGLLSKDFLKLVLVALVIGSPVAWYLMDKWLADFAYRTEISWLVFAAAGALA
ncbi:MAG: ABC transporter permease, partial [Cytophagales bacterium]